MNPQRLTRHSQRGFSLIELLIVVLFLSALATIAIPRMNLTGLHRRMAETTALKIVTDLRRTRTMAISDAAVNTDGFQLKFHVTGNVSVSAGSGHYYEIINLHTNDVVDTHELDPEVTVKCKGNGEYDFGPLGNVQKNAGKEIMVSAQGKTIVITPETGGAVKWSESQ